MLIVVGSYVVCVVLACGTNAEIDSHCRPAGFVEGIAQLVDIPYDLATKIIALGTGYLLEIQ